MNISFIRQRFEGIILPDPSDCFQADHIFTPRLSSNAERRRRVKLLTVKEAAEMLGCTPSSLYLAVEQGRLKHVRQLGRIGLRQHDVEAYGKQIGQANGWTKRSNRVKLTE
jgi:excisionase family DNA binding protein